MISYYRCNGSIAFTSYQKYTYKMELFNFHWNKVSMSSLSILHVKVTAFPPMK